jgi:hypothetical protein
VGALASVGSQFYRRGVLGGQDSLLQHFTQLLEAHPRADELERELTILLRPDTGSMESSAVAKIVEEANSLSRSVNKAIRLVPGAMDK